MDTQILTSITLTPAIVILVFCLIPAIKIGFMSLKAKQNLTVSGSFHKCTRKISTLGNEIPIEIDGAIMKDAKISNDLLSAAIDEMTTILANEDVKWGRCLVQKSTTLDIHGTPSEAISWFLEALEVPVIWRGQTDLNGSVVETYELQESETKMRFSTTKSGEALQVPTDYVYHQS